MTEQIDIVQLWNDIVAVRKDVGNKLCQAFDESLKNGPRSFYVLDESTGEELWPEIVYEYPLRTGTRPRVVFPEVESEITCASICERKAERDLVIRKQMALYIGDQAAVRIIGDDKDEALYDVLIQAERKLFNILWPEDADD